MELPDGWENAELQDVAKWGSGGTPKRGIEGLYGGTIPWVKTGELNEGTITDTSEKITELALKNSSAKLFPKGSVAIAMYGATIGKTAMFGIEAATNQACAVAQVNDKTYPYYLFYYLKSQKKNFIELGKGGAQPNISQTVLKCYPIPLPPKPEQEEIVRRLDALMGQHQQLKARLDAFPQWLKDFRQSVLHQAVTGMFSPSSKRDWKSITIGDVATVKGGKRLPKDHVLIVEKTSNPYIRARDLKEGTVIDSNLMFLKPETHQQIKRYIVHAGDVYITIVGAKIGDAGIIPENMDGANLTENAAKLIDFKGVLGPYLSLWLRADICQSNISESIKSAAQGKLALSRIKELPISLPQIDEQQEIVKRVEKLLALADGLEAQYGRLKTAVDDLPQALLSKAFSGELTKAWREKNHNLVAQ